MNSEERKEAFLKDFQALLDKHQAEFEVGDDGGPYGRQQGTANISMPSEYDHKNDVSVNEFVEFDLPNWMEYKK